MSRKGISRLKFAFLITGTALGLVPATASALEPGRFQLGVSAGQVGLLGDPGSGGANALGYGLLGGFQLDDRLALNIQFIRSSHTRVNHSALSVGGDFYVGDYTAAYPHISAGMSFISNEFKNGDVSGNAAAIYIGGGLDFELKRNLVLGPEFRYQKAFEASGKLNNQDIHTVQDSYNVMIRLIYQFTGED